MNRHERRKEASERRRAKREGRPTTCAEWDQYVSETVILRVGEPVRLKCETVEFVRRTVTSDVEWSPRAEGR